MRYTPCAMLCALCAIANAQELEREFTHTVWKYKTSGGILSSPVISEGIAYFGSYNKNLYAVDLATGQQKWKYKTKNNVGYRPAVGESMVYFTSYGDYLYAVDIKTGQEKWKFKAKGGALSSPIVANDLVFFGSYDKYFYAVDAKTGRLKWKYYTKDGITSLSTIAGGMVFFGSYGKYLHAVDVNTGKRIWKIQLHANVRHAPVISEGIVYFGSYDQYLYAVDAKTGKQKWSFKTKGGVLATPVLSGDVIYISSHGKLFYAINKKTGKKIWQFKTKGDVVSSAIVSDEIVYFGTRGKFLYVVDAKTGQEEWKYKTHGGILSSPAVFKGVVYFGSFDRKLYALQRISLINVYGKVANAATGQPIQTNLTIHCLDNDQIIGFVKNDPETGEYIITFLDTIYCHQYKLLASDPFLLPDSLIIDIFVVAENKDINFDLELLPISGTAKNVLTNEPIGTEITIKCIDNDQILGIAKTNPKDGTWKITIPAGKRDGKIPPSGGLRGASDCFKYAVIASDTTLFPGGLIIDIFEIAERKDLIFDLQIIPISGKATNVLTGKPIETEIVVRCLDNNKIIGFAKTSPVDGSYNIIFATGGDCFKYEVLASDTTLFPGGLKIETIDLKGELKDLNFDLSILHISGKVTNVKTKEPVETEVTVICLENGEVVSIAKTKAEDGSYSLAFAHDKDCFTYSVLATDSSFFPVTLNIDMANVAKLKDLSFDLSLVPIEVGQTMRLNSIFFHTGKANLKDESLPELDRMLKLLQDYSTISIEVSGHTDNVGSDVNNAKLSQKRAQAVTDYLIKKGTVKERMLVKGWGETKPVSDNDTDEGRQLNRRVEFTILKK